MLQDFRQKIKDKIQESLGKVREKAKKRALIAIEKACLEAPGKAKEEVIKEINKAIEKLKRKKKTKIAAEGLKAVRGTIASITYHVVYDAVKRRARPHLKKHALKIIDQQIDKLHKTLPIAGEKLWLTSRIFIKLGIKNIWKGFLENIKKWKQTDKQQTTQEFLLALIKSLKTKILQQTKRILDNSKQVTQKELFAIIEAERPILKKSIRKAIKKSILTP